jgi:hypothetical protein
MTQAQLHSEIVARSEATAWDEAKREWTLKNVWMSDDPETCLCGHHPIKEICEIENQVNHKVTEVGNCCVNHFLGIDTQGIFPSIRKVRKNAGASFNEGAIRLAHQLGIISEKDRDFYWDIWRKRVLSDRQLKWKNDINKKMMARFLKKRS